MKKTSKIATLITALAIALILTGCSGSAGGSSSTDSNTSTNQTTSADPLSGHRYILTQVQNNGSVYTMQGTIMYVSNGSSSQSVEQTNTYYSRYCQAFSSPFIFSNGTVTNNIGSVYTGPYTVNGSTASMTLADTNNTSSSFTISLSTTNNWESFTCLSGPNNEDILTYARQN